MPNNVANIVAGIIKEVGQKGDLALCRYAKRFDGLSLSPRSLRVSLAELKNAQKQVSPGFLKALAESAKQVRLFAESERKRTMKSWTEKRGSIRVGQWVRPVDSAGLYIPGGRFPYPSTVLMTAIPARVAGVKRIIMCTPPKNLTPEVLAAAAYVGIDEIYKVGGAGAIAAMALGTKTIRPVHFIVGPGNAFVAEAKRQLYGTVGIDSLAGPSEVVIIADRSASLEAIQKDLLAQAEHDPDSRSMCFSTDAKLLSDVKKGLDPLIKNRVQLIKTRTIEEAIERVNDVAPEHFELLVKNAEKYLPKIRHAGAIFLGPATTAVLGDYVAGPSHVLPTHRSARFSSGLSVNTFLKRSSVMGFAGKASERAQWEAALTFAQTEGMTYHEASLRCRMQKNIQ